MNTYGDGQETLLLRLKTERSGSWQLFWKRAGDVAFASARSILIPVVASSDFQIVSADLSTNDLWVGQNITTWRIDPVGTGAVTYDFEIDYLLLGPKGDFDGDGIPDTTETLVDTDGDGLPNMADLDSNGNGWSDAREVSKGWNPVSSDTDGDGIDNDWEIQYGFNPHDDLEDAWDLDEDGYTTLAEHIALTDPANGLDYFIISGMAHGTNVYVDGRIGRTYTLQASTNLVSSVWKPVNTLVAPTDGPLVLVDTNDRASAVYRVNVEK